METVDDSGTVLGQSFLTLNGAGEPAIAYQAQQGNRRAVMVARRRNGHWSHEDTGGAGLADGVPISIGIDSHDLPHLAYRGAGSHAIYAVSDGAAWSAEEIPTGGGVVVYDVATVSMQLYRRLWWGGDPDIDMPAVAYRDSNNHDQLTVALKPGGGSWQFSTADPSSTDALDGVSLAYDSSDSLRIAYVIGVNDGTDPFPERLKLAEVKPTVVEGDPPWPPPEFFTNVIDHDVRAVETVSMARNTSSTSLIAYADHKEGYVRAWISKFGQPGPTIESVVQGNGGASPRRPSAATGPGERAFVAYLDNGRIMLAQRAPDHSWSSQQVAPGGGWPSLAFGSDGTAHLAYGTGTLMYARGVGGHA
ncbi:hypothetical protein SNA_11585 [Streptomyces natalensis ATCC 27448]|uniref:Uncharacterized protein n=1 Tax=Streptomyces natalensis ATCC 27448 TaxID=1240678 RepID=A0A0D7CN16_9ACTN|nr:hypothetical protein SNA_11585 [Streptomyces natalensis ATCC 27448]